MGIQINYNYEKATVNTSTTSIDSISSTSTSLLSTISTSHEFSTNELAAISIFALILSILLFLVLMICVICKCKSRQAVQNIALARGARSNNSPVSDTVVSMDAITTTSTVQPAASTSLPLYSVAPPAPLEPYTKKQKFETFTTIKVFLQFHFILGKTGFLFEPHTCYHSVIPAILSMSSFTSHLFSHSIHIFAFC